MWAKIKAFLAQPKAHFIAAAMVQAAVQASPPQYQLILQPLASMLLGTGLATPTPQGK